MDQELLDEKLYLNITANQSTMYIEIDLVFNRFRKPTSPFQIQINYLIDFLARPFFISSKELRPSPAYVLILMRSTSLWLSSVKKIQPYRILDYLQINNNIYMKYSAPIIDGTDIEK